MIPKNYDYGGMERKQSKKEEEKLTGALRREGDRGLGVKNALRIYTQ